MAGKLENCNHVPPMRSAASDAGTVLAVASGKIHDQLHETDSDSVAVPSGPLRVLSGILVLITGVVCLN